MRRLPLLLAALAALAPARAQDDVPIQRYLAHLYLGDSLEVIQKVYPPAREWPSYREPRGGVRRYRVEREFAKSMPIGVETMWVGLKRDRLVEVQLVYDEEFTRRRPLEALARELSLTYGEPQRTDGKFWWTDGSTVLRAFHYEHKLVSDGGTGIELRTALQLMEESLFRRR